MDFRSRSNHNIAGEVAECKKKSLIEKAKDHKMEIAIGAVTVLSAVAIVLFVKNKTTLMAAIKPPHTEGILANSLETRNNAVPIISEAIPTSVPTNSPIGMTNIRGHIRNLPEGWKPSISKIESAEKLGYCLDEHQTWVNSYTKAAS